MRIAVIILALCLTSIAVAEGQPGTSLRPVTHEDLWMMRRLGTPEEVARAACFLTGPDAEFVTGQTIDVAGGWMMT